MKKDDFWTLSLVVFLGLGFMLDWNIWIKTVVILNALLVLCGIVFRLWEAKKNARK